MTNRTVYDVVLLCLKQQQLPHNTAIIERALHGVAWPSGLRRWFKAPVISMAWVRIPPLPDFSSCGGVGRECICPFSCNVSHIVLKLPGIPPCHVVITLKSHMILYSYSLF